MTRPATGIDTSTPSAICGSTPMVTNSVVPMAKPPMASAMIASRKCAARVPPSAGAVRGSVAGLVTVTMVEPDAADRLFGVDHLDLGLHDEDLAG